MPELRMRAIRFEQHGRVFYETVMPAGELIRRSKVDIWRAEDDQTEAGYQREPSRGRLREVANYVERDDSILPTGGLLNARSHNGPAYGRVLKFEADAGEEGSIQSGWLTIPSSLKNLWTVDMQHRLGGLHLAIDADNREDLADFPMVATIADGLSKLEEVEQFDLINTTQKKIRTDLARRTMSIRAQDRDKRREFDRKGRLWEARGPMIVDWLNRSSEVWKEKIIPPNAGKKEWPEGIIRETSFVTSLKPILQTPLFVRTPDEQVAIVIDRFWTAVKLVFEEAFGNTDGSVIQKTPGIFSLHTMVPEVVEVLRSRGQPTTSENIVEVITRWAELGADFWDRDNEEGAARFGSMKGFSILAADLRDKLPELQDVVV
jgi:DGQHR domain-containing protein